ncbi:MAG: 50S ribosomal protein L29 [Elusimicrobia bacterium RIFOXYA2_FULL_39_19]|nr:MAG: 50S ribosomal protein L29 [Elusimicrobia bacterium RIFOXYA2_FULL_39_19]
MKTKQFKEMKDQTLNEIMVQYEQIQKKLFTKMLQHKNAPLKNPLEIRELRKDIARIKTVIKQKFNKKI